MGGCVRGIVLTLAYAGTRPWLRRLLVSVAAGAPLACGDTGEPVACSQAQLPSGARIQVTGSVVVAGVSPPQGVPDVQIAVEYGGVYLPWCDMSHASPYYLFGTVSDGSGSFAIQAREGTLGFHAFANGYYYSRATLDTSSGTNVVIELEPLPQGQPQPALTGAAFDKTTVGPGESVTLSARVATYAAADPLSDETVVVEATQSLGMELDPPSRGAKDRFPDGLWKRTFPAPATAGTYTYGVSATTAGCVSSPLAAVTLTVR
jgi:hypothetical protein